MIIKNKYSDTENFLFPREIENIIAHSKVDWEKSKEDIWMKMETKLEQTPVVIKMRPNIFFRIVQYAAVAVIALLLVFSATAALYTKKIQTDLTEQTFLLPDKSKVKLYANSTLSYKPFLWKFSRTSKLKGEAFFEVEKGEKFEVISEKAKTVVLGTRFTVTARDNEYFVNCEQGKVMVIETVNKNEAVITAGESAKLQTNSRFKITREEIKTPADMKLEEKNETTKPTGTEEKTLKTTLYENTISEPEKRGELHQEKNQYQEPNKPDVKSEETHKNIENVVDEAKSMFEKTETKQPTAGNQEKATLQETQKKPESNAETAKNRFKNSLTKKQIEILEDNKMSREEKQKAFIKTLSNEQKELLREQNKEAASGNVNNNKNVIKDNIKEEQKNQNKNQMQNSPNNNKNSDNVINGKGKHTK